MLYALIVEKVMFTSLTLSVVRMDHLKQIIHYQIYTVIIAANYIEKINN
jgi:hypothetical protein